MKGKQLFRWLIAGITAISLFAPITVLAEGEEGDPAAAATNDIVETKVTVNAGGRNTQVTARTGHMNMNTSLGQYEMFFTSYTSDNASDPSKRPITFAFNGGPGSSSVWLHMGMMGPERLDVNSEGMLEQTPTGTKKNKYSILDVTDLVFIDPVGTGYSKASGGTDENVFYSYVNDIISVGDFIRTYLTEYNRMASPKYIAGESYGTVRAVGVADYLSNQCRLDVNGLMLISSVNDYSAVYFSATNELPYVSYLPSYAAAAWYHNMLAKKYQDMELEDYLDEVRAFASEEYLTALYKGSRLTDAEKNEIAGKMAAYTGLKKDLILENNLRITSDTFCTKLLGSRNLTIGRSDIRYTGPTTGTELGTATADPSFTGVAEAFTAAYLDYTSGVLGYKTSQPYETLSSNVNNAWDYGFHGQFLNQEKTIRNLLSHNKFLNIWVLCGYYDLATPFYSAEWVYSHIFANDEVKDHVSFSYYPAGHMFYMNEECLSKFHEEANAWYKGE